MSQPQEGAPGAVKSIPPPRLAQTRGSPFFRAFAEVVLRHRLLCLLATFSLTAITGYSAAKALRADTSEEHLLAGGADAKRVLHEVRAEFGNDGLWQLMVEGDVFSADYLRRLRALHAELEAFAMALPSGKRLEEGQTGLGQPAQPPGATTGSGDDWSDEGWGDEGWSDERGGSLLDDVLSLINVRHTVGTGDGIQVVGLFAEQPTAVM